MCYERMMLYNLKIPPTKRVQSHRKNAKAKIAKQVQQLR
jgi:hypothetical protein